MAEHRAQLSTGFPCPLFFLAKCLAYLAAHLCCSSPGQSAIKALNVCLFEHNGIVIDIITYNNMK